MKTAIFATFRDTFTHILNMKFYTDAPLHLYYLKLGFLKNVVQNFVAIGL